MRKHSNSADFGNKIQEFERFYENEKEHIKTSKELIMPLLQENSIKCGKDFACTTELNVEFLSRIYNESSPSFKYEIVLAICVGLRAGLTRTIEILESFGYVLKKDKLGHAISYVMMQQYSSIHEVNDFLIDCKLPPLGSRQYKK